MNGPIGVTREEANAVAPPPEWASDVLSYHPAPEDHAFIDYYASVGPLAAEYVVVVKTSNVVAQNWTREQVLRSLTYEFMSTDGCKTFQFLTNDVALERLLDQKTCALLAEEFHERMHQLGKDGLARERETFPSVVSRRFKTPHCHSFEVHARAIYGDAAAPKSTFEQLSRIQLPLFNERIKAYLEHHEGGGNAVAIPISYWNRAVSSYMEHVSK